jgi:hypothetical protein
MLTMQHTGQEAKTKYTIILGGLLYIAMTIFVYADSKPGANLRYLAWLILSLLMITGFVALLLRSSRRPNSLGIKRSAGGGYLAVAALLLFGAQQIAAYWGTRPGFTLHFVYLICGIGVVAAGVSAAIIANLKPQLTKPKK